MRIQSRFTDDRTRTVERKLTRPILDVELHVDSGETRTYADIPLTTGSKVLFLQSDLTLDDGATGIAASVKDGGTTEHTLQLHAGKPVVLPMDGDWDTVEIVSTSSSAGEVRVMVYE